MNNEAQEKFRTDLFDSLGKINNKLKEEKQLNEDEMCTLLLSSILEEEG